MVGLGKCGDWIMSDSFRRCWILALGQVHKTYCGRALDHFSATELDPGAATRAVSANTVKPRRFSHAHTIDTTNQKFRVDYPDRYPEL